MARNDPFTPDAGSVDAGNSVTFDGSSGASGSAIVSGIFGNFDAEIYIDDSPDNGSTWNEVTVLEGEDGETTFAASWFSQFNRLMVSSSSRRIRVENVGSASGYVAVDGDER